MKCKCGKAMVEQSVVIKNERGECMGNTLIWKCPLCKLWLWKDESGAIGPGMTWMASMKREGIDRPM